jgi:hypothetical protein
MPKPSANQANNSKINVTFIDDQVVSVVDKKVVTALGSVLIVIVFVSLYAQWQNQHRIEQVAELRCEQRTKLESLVTKETNEIARIDAMYFERISPAWVRDRTISLSNYAKARKQLGREECDQSNVTVHN